MIFKMKNLKNASIAMLSIGIIFSSCEGNGVSNEDFAKLQEKVDSLEKNIVKLEPKQTKGTHNGHEWVDLGTGVKWATLNLGANKPEESGIYCAWGETQQQPENPESYSWKLYKFGTEENLTKYNGEDNKLDLDPEDDAATKNWGGSWRMPTYEEMDDLIKFCIAKWTVQNGTYGRKFISVINGESIFLPVGGVVHRNGVSDKTGGYYWLCSLDVKNKKYENAFFLYFNASEVRINSSFRDDGQFIRPVCLLEE